MYLLIFIFIFFLGTIIGSFLNVVIYRFNTGRTIVNGRSMCMSCSNTLRWYELIPVFSFLIQSGKCRRCASRISHQYPLVEIVTGIVFALISLKFLPILETSYWLYISVLSLFVFIFSLLIVISVYDLKHKIIPDKLVYTFAIVSFISMFFNFSGYGELFFIPSWEHIFAGPILALPFIALWYFSKGRLMGLGDGKLMIGMGWMLGLSSALCATVLSFWIGTIVSLGIMFILGKKNKMNMKTEIPFAPFLIVSTFIVFLFNLDIMFIINIFGV